MATMPMNALAAHLSATHPSHKRSANAPPSQDRPQEVHRQPGLQRRIQHCQTDNDEPMRALKRPTPTRTHAPMNKKSRPSMRFARSVVTKLLIFPIKFPLPADESFSFALSLSLTSSSPFFAGSLPFAVAVLVPLIVLARTVVSSSLDVLPLAPSSDPASGSAMDALSGVCAAVVARLGDGDSAVSAFMRMRSEWSKTSCVMIASHRTSMRVCTTHPVSFSAQRGDMGGGRKGGEGVGTDRVEDVELEGDGAEDRPQEQPGDPDPRADDGTFPVVLEVPSRKCQ